MRGEKVRADLPTGKSVAISVPPGVTPGQQVRLRGQGFPCVFAGDYDGRDGGDHTLTAHRDLIDRLLRLRHAHAWGPQEDHFLEPNCIGWVRTGNDQHPGTMVVLINNADDAELELDTGRNEATFRRDDDEQATVQTDAHGVGRFPCPGGGLAVYLAEA